MGEVIRTEFLRQSFQFWRQQPGRRRAIPTTRALHTDGF